jgi:hypothetical protein
VFCCKPKPFDAYGNAFYQKNTTQYLISIEIDKEQQSKGRNDGKQTTFKNLKEYNTDWHRLS